MSTLLIPAGLKACKPACNDEDPVAIVHFFAGVVLASMLPCAMADLQMRDGTGNASHQCCSDTHQRKNFVQCQMTRLRSCLVASPVPLRYVPPHLGGPASAAPPEVWPTLHRHHSK